MYDFYKDYYRRTDAIKWADKTMIGRTLGGKYKIYDKVGGGGMAEVYLARDLSIGEIVALKILRSQFTEGTDYIERFQREAKSAMKLVHPNICAVKDFGQDGDVYYMVMEFVEGKTLSHIIEEKGPLSVPEAVSYVKQSALALGEAYKNGIIAHRDVKSQNIMVKPDGTIKMMDFGIAKSRDYATMTTAGSFIGTPEYMSPEQAQGAKTDARSDIYSLGVVLYEALAGEVPFEADTPWGVLNMHISKEPFPIDNLRTDIPSGMVEVLKRLLAKKPDERFQSPTEVVQALDVVMSHYKAPKGQKVQAKKIPRSNAKLKRTVKNILLGLLVAAVIGGAAVLFMILGAVKPGSIYLSSSPSQASIFMKGPNEDDFIDTNHKTNFELSELRPGKYEFKLVYEGYEPAIIEQRIISGERINTDTIILKHPGKLTLSTKKIDFGKKTELPGPISISLENVGESDMVVIRANNADWILLDKEPLTLTPGAKKTIMLSVDSNKVKPGNTYSDTLTLSTKGNEKEAIKLPISFVYEKESTSNTSDSNSTTGNTSTGNTGKTNNTGSTKPPLKTGTLSVSCNVSGAQVRVNGIIEGTAPLSKTYPPGTYTVNVRKGIGYTTFEKKVTITAGGNVSVTATLKRN